MLERRPYRLEVSEDVRVIELDVVDHCDLWQVMHKLAALVEKRRVVFVPFDNEPFAFGEPRALAQVIRDAADEIARLEAVVLEDPRQQRGRRGLAMRARDHQRPLPADEKLLKQLRQRTV